MLREQIDFIYGAGETKRFHTFPVLRTQNIAAHSWHVAMLLYLIYGQQEPGIRPALLMAALLHDAAEFKVGDLPAPAKRTMNDRLPGLVTHGGKSFKQHWDDMEQSILAEVNLDFDKFLTPDEVLQLKLCDSLEGMFYCANERSLGNQRISECFYNFDTYVEALMQEMKPHNHADRPRIITEPEFTTYEKAQAVQDYARELWETANGGF